MKKLLTLLLITLLLSSCALLDKLRGAANPHSEILIEVPVVEDVTVPVPTEGIEDIRG